MNHEQLIIDFVVQRMVQQELPARFLEDVQNEAIDRGLQPSVIKPWPTAPSDGFENPWPDISFEPDALAIIEKIAELVPIRAFGSSIRLMRNHHYGVARDGGEPYLNHCLRVGYLCLLEDLGTQENSRLLPAAFCHDTWEDPNQHGEMLPWYLLTEHLGGVDCHLVWWLSSPHHCERRLKDVSRSRRKALALEKLEHAPWKAQVIKAANILDNVTSLLGSGRDIDDARGYLREQLELSAVLTRKLLTTLPGARCGAYLAEIASTICAMLLKNTK